MKYNSAVSNILAAIFGCMFLALSFLVSFETIARKVFSFSIQGADELGGYALAVGSSLAFSVALLGRSHIRIDVLHTKLPFVVQCILNWLAAVLMALFGGLFLWTGYETIRDTMDYGSTSHTPWMTPQIYPQGAWYVALVLFSALAIILGIRASYLLVSRRLDDLQEEFHPKGAIEELVEELEDVQRRDSDG
jgi:TRAP-type C4-dicarboxylate transport system permease small subunit